MALKDYEEVRGRVSRIQQRLNAELETIRQNTAYSDHGRKVEMAKATVKARNDAGAIKEKFLAARKARRESLEKRLFGIAGTPSATELMVMRDSRDRAATIGSADEATTKLLLANQAGDTFMARAIAQVASNHGWTAVVDRFGETAPIGTKTALEELAEIPSGIRTKIGDAAVFAIRAPKELGTHNGENLEHIANGAREVTVTGTDRIIETHTV